MVEERNKDYTFELLELVESRTDIPNDHDEIVSYLNKYTLHTGWHQYNIYIFRENELCPWRMPDYVIEEKIYKKIIKDITDTNIVRFMHYAFIYNNYHYSLYWNVKEQRYTFHRFPVNARDIIDNYPTRLISLSDFKKIFRFKKKSDNLLNELFDN